MFDIEIKQVQKMLDTRSTPILLSLMGELGSGKTTFIQQLAKKLGVKEYVISPSFIIHKEYTTSDPQRFLHHLDLYRIIEEFELDELRIPEMLKDKNVIAIEWADKFPEYIEKLTNLSNVKHVYINFEHVSENTRKIVIEEEKV